MKPQFPKIRALRAPRYANHPKVREQVKDLIREHVHKMNFKQWQKFIKDVVLEHFNDQEIALLGANDRYFLMTELMDCDYAVHPFLYERCRQVEASPDGNLDLWSRGHFKSTIMTFAGTIQEIIINPEITIGIFSETKDISEKFLEQIKSELEKDKLPELYPDVFFANPKTEARKWSLSKGLVVNRKTNPKESTVEAQGLLKAMPTGRHYDLMIFDDCITDRYAQEPGMVQQAIKAIQLSTNLSKRDLRRWFIGTRYSFRDPYGWLIGEGMVNVRLIPATEDGTENGKPVFLTPAQWAEWKRNQPDTYHAQMLQDPLTGKRQMFRPEQFKRYEVRPSVLRVYILCDPSTGKKGKDNTAMVVIGVDSRNNLYVLDGYCHKMTLHERWTNLSRLWKKWLNTVGVENVEIGYESYGMQTDTDYFDIKGDEDNTIGRLPYVELNWTRDGQDKKEDRVQRLQANFQEGNFYLPNVIKKFGTIKNEDGEDESGWYEYEWHMATRNDGIEQIKKIGLNFELKRGLSPIQRKMEHLNQAHLIVKPIVRMNEVGQAYDFIEQLIAEFLYFPLGERDDIPDAASRIYDMKYTPPLTGLTRTQSRTEVVDP